MRRKQYDALKCPPTRSTIPNHSVIVIHGCKMQQPSRYPSKRAGALSSLNAKYELYRMESQSNSTNTHIPGVAICSLSYEKLTVSHPSSSSSSEVSGSACQASVVLRLKTFSAAQPFCLSHSVAVLASTLVLAQGSRLWR